MPIPTKKDDARTLREIGKRVITRVVLRAVLDGDHHTICFGQSGDGDGGADECLDHAKILFQVATYLETGSANCGE